MSDVITGLTLPIILTVIGALFLLLGIAGKVQIKVISISLSSGERKGLAACGIVFVFIGVLVHILPVYVVPKTEPTLTPTSTLPATLTPALTNTEIHTSTPAQTPTPTSMLTFTPIPTDSYIPTPTSTLSPTNTPTPTSTFTPTATPTPTFTLTPTPTPCFCQSAMVDDTLRCLIHAESEAANGGDLTLIQQIFAPDATIRRGDTGKEWDSPRAYYEPAFASLNFTDARHFDIYQIQVTDLIARYTSGSSGYYAESNATPTPYYHDNPSEHWTFGKNDAGCWVIIEFEFNASHIPFPPE